MKKISPLTLLGLKNEDIAVYEVLIEHGNLSPTELCAKTNLYRPTVYASLQSLIGKDLISIVPSGKRNKYAANSPKRLKELSDEQEKTITEEIIRLEELGVFTPNIPKVTIRQGKQAIRALYEELVIELKKKEIYYRYHSIDTDNWTSGKYITQRARLIRDAKELERYVITNEANKKRKANRITRHIKVLPKKHDLFTHNVGQVMYGNKTAIIDYNSETATIIESEAITAFQITLFKTLFHYL
jgi:sugar-specific transcriptional regulator TrmB